MKVSVIIPYYNAHETIDRCLAPLLSHLDCIDIYLIDDASPTPFQSNNYPDVNVITHANNKGPSATRNTGMKQSNPDLYIFIDADVVIEKSDIRDVIKRFTNDKAVAFTVQHSKETTTHNFYSQYKAFYMNYSFSRSASFQGKDTQFLYSSFCGLKNLKGLSWPEHIRYGEDAYLATLILNQNKKISFYSDLELQHLKKYTLKTLLKNDFIIPFHFVSSFKLKKDKSSHAHTNNGQLMAIALTPFIYITWPVWLILNYSFFTSLSELGIFRVVLLTLVDQFVMGCGILSGFITYSLLGLRKSQSISY